MGLHFRAIFKASHFKINFSIYYLFSLRQINSNLQLLGYTHELFLFVCWCPLLVQVSGWRVSSLPLRSDLCILDALMRSALGYWCSFVSDVEVINLNVVTECNFFLLNVLFSQKCFSDTMKSPRIAAPVSGTLDTTAQMNDV